MPILKNVTRERLAAGKAVLGLGVRMSRSTEIGMIAAASGFDFLMIDREHSAIDMDAAAQIATAALTQSVTPFVRTPGPEAFHAIPLLDAGVQGLIVPHVDSAEEARALVREFRFPPLGHRSVSRNSAASAFQTMSIADFTSGANAEMMLVPILETPKAIENAEAIAAVEGIDVLMIGASDLCAEYGIYDKFDDPRIAEAFRIVGAACKRHGKVMGMGGIRSEDLVHRYMAMGARFLIAGSDVPLLLGAGKALTSGLRKIESEGA